MVERTQYLNARVRAMKGELLSDSDYQKLLKMDNHEISEFLEKSSYRDEVDSLGIRYDGKKLVELAIIKDQVRTAEKLEKISEGRANDIISTYFLKYDIRNLRKLLRWKNSDSETRMSSETLKEYLKESPRLSEADFERLMAEDMVFEELKDFIAGRFPELKVDFDSAEDEREFEVLLDKGYYLALASVLRKDFGLSHQVKNFLASRIDAANLKTLVRLKEREESETITDYLILPDKGSRLGRIGGEALKRMVEETWSEFMESVRDTYFSEFIEDGEISREEFENCLRRAEARYTETLNLARPDSVGPVLGYMSSKEQEVENLRAVVRAKELGVPEQEIRERLVF